MRTVQICDDATCGECYRCMIAAEIEDLLEIIEGLLARENVDDFYNSYCSRDRESAIRRLTDYGRLEIIEDSGTHVVARKVKS